MSSEERLKRLGLAHLSDKPEELKKEIERRLHARHKEEEEWLKLCSLQSDNPNPTKNP
ncbi:hypothetical protein TUMEXPCC7403_00210 [Tumidithrix helvetica PCC 7403]|uniref:hypothetical protein n=1 Tax=Tumidithrix helvetica TaxID=3457545 RepID=UPI003CB0166F